MADHIGRLILQVAIAGAIVVATWVGYRYYSEHYVVQTDDGGVAVARVISGRLYGASDLRVSHLSGVVQATSNAKRLWGWLESSRVVKAPYEVDYFVSLRDLDSNAFRYDETTKSLLVEVPGVAVGHPNVDEANVTIDQTSGVYVSRDAMAELQKRVSASAVATVAANARKPENIRRARDNARVALERLFSGTLAAAGLSVDVHVRFADEPVRNDERWDTSRSLQDVLGNRN